MIHLLDAFKEAQLLNVDLYGGADCFCNHNWHKNLIFLMFCCYIMECNKMLQIPPNFCTFHL